MKKVFILFFVICLIAVTSVYAANGPHGAAPNSGDGVPDGSGLESPFGSCK